MGGRWRGSSEGGYGVRMCVCGGPRRGLVTRESERRPAGVNSGWPTSDSKCITAPCRDNSTLPAPAPAHNRRAHAI
eukprot:2363704-Rhodomonas_salina.1